MKKLIFAALALVLTTTANAQSPFENLKGSSVTSFEGTYLVRKAQYGEKTYLAPIRSVILTSQELKLLGEKNQTIETYELEQMKISEPQVGQICITENVESTSEHSFTFSDTLCLMKTPSKNKYILNKVLREEDNYWEDLYNATLELEKM